MIDIEFLGEICEIPGAPGFEQRIRRRIVEICKDLADDVRLDAMGNVIAVRKGRERKRVMIAAHMDEISFITTHIDEEGFVRFHPLGGFDPKTLTAQRVIIHGSQDIVGVMGTKPIHVMKPEERKTAPDISEFFIDTGLKKEELTKYVSVGAPITRERKLIEMGDCVNAKSLDNRVSVFILIEALKALKGKDLPYDLHAVFTVQEEVGLRGAMAASSDVNPDFSIVLDVTMAYDLPNAQPHEKVTELGKGTAIKLMDGSTICDYRMVNFLKETATSSEIPHQMEILPAGGTDAAAMQRYGKGGSITGGISIPTRYLHQVIEMAHKSDIKATIDLLSIAIESLDDYDWTFK
jgi:endoglucanase